ncbi:MAG: hypothetical protein ACHREM_15310, partial [Polyangiales bacterium]
RLTASDVLQTLQARVATLEVENARHIRERAEESDFSGKMLATLSEREEQMRKLRSRLEDAERALDNERFAAGQRRTELETGAAEAERRAEEATAKLAKLQGESDRREQAARETISALERRLSEASSSAEDEDAKLAARLASSGADRARAYLAEAQKLDDNLYTLRSRAYGAAEDMLRRLLDGAPSSKVMPEPPASKLTPSAAQPSPASQHSAPTSEEPAPKPNVHDAPTPQHSPSAPRHNGGTPTLVLDSPTSTPVSQRQVLPTAANSTDSMVALHSLPPEDDGPELVVGAMADEVDSDIDDAFDAAMSKRRDAG